MLHVKNLNAYYGPIQVLKNCSLHVDQGEIVSIIGANGAGKTTLLLSISGLIDSISGEITFLKNSIKKLSPNKIVQSGIAHCPEGRQLFSPLTVEENLLLGAYARKNSTEKEIQQDLEWIYNLFPRLSERKKQISGTLSGGEQQMLAIGRALMAKPKLLLLDEPSLGLAPKLVETILKTIVELNKNGMTILLVEQNAQKALEIAHRAYVLETGRITLQGRASDLAEDSEIKRAYLGKDYKELSER